MTSFEAKKSEWHEQALASDDLKAQVGRPFDDEAWQGLVDDIKVKLSLTEGSTYSLLDIGCGNGLLLSQLSNYTSDISGIDYAQAMVTEARKLIPSGNFEQGEAANLPFDENTSERTLCYSIFHYFPEQSYAVSAIEEMIRVTKPGGIILIGDLLDATFEQEIKSNSDLAIEANLPLIHRYSQWTFYTLENILEHFSGHEKVTKIEKLAQPTNFPLSHYRKDIKIWL